MAAPEGGHDDEIGGNIWVIKSRMAASGLRDDDGSLMPKPGDEVDLASNLRSTELHPRTAG
jgi:hypothetical protein